MALFEKSALKDGVAVREVWGWALFDAANSGYSTVVLTAVFNAYFVGTICGDADWATFLWTTVVAASNLICLIVMPGIGRAADRQGNKKRWLFWATAVCILATAALLFCREGSVILAALLVIVSNIGYSVGESLNSAFLPELAKKDALGRVSGWGWSLGYGGGLVTLALCLGLFAIGRTLGYTESDMVPTTGPVTAAVFAVTALPFFLWVKERSEPQSAVKPAAHGFFEAFAEAAAAVKVLPRFKDFGLLTLTGFLYQCGIATVIALAAVYAVAVMGFTVTQTLILVLLVNITAAVGAFFFGYAQDRLGHKLALALTLIVWIVMVVLAAADDKRMGLLDCGESRGTCHGIEPVGGTRHDRNACARKAAGGIFRSLEYGALAFCGGGARHVRRRQLGDGQQSAAGDFSIGSLFCRGAFGAFAH